MAIAYVQSTSVAGGVSVTSATITYGGGITAGSLLVCGIATFNNPGAITVSDNVNGSWTQAGTNIVQSQTGVAIFYFLNSAATSGPSTLTVTINTTNGAFITRAVGEYSGVATSSALNSTVQNTFVGAQPSTGTCTATAGDLVVAVYGEQSIADSSCTVASPFTLREHKNGSVGEGLGFAEDVNAAGSEGASFTLNANVTGAAMAASFHPAGGGGVVTIGFVGIGAISGGLTGTAGTGTIGHATCG